MATPFQVASLITSPSFPNSVVWSDDNLIAVATGDIVTIMSPEHPQSPRGVITLAPGKPFPVGVIDKADLLSGCLLPICLSRDRQPCVRSLSWSPVGFTPHNGCLLAVCSTEGRVKVFRQPYCEFQAEWIEVTDISELQHECLSKINYGELEAPSSVGVDVTTDQDRTDNTIAVAKSHLSSGKQRKRKMDKDPREMDASNADSLCGNQLVKAVPESVVYRNSTLQEGSAVEVFKMDGGQKVWVAGRLQRLEGSMALVNVCETNASGEPQWFKMDSASATHNKPNNTDVPGAYANHSFPKIRPSMDVGRLPEQIVLIKDGEVGEILKSGQLVEAWSTDRWLEGNFLGFSKAGLLVKFNGDAEAMALNANLVRLAPLWIAEEKSWKVTVFRLHVQELSEVNVTRSDSEKVPNFSQTSAVASYGMNSSKRTLNRSARTKHLLTAHQYASRSSMLASVAVAWSPQLQLSATDPEKACGCCCLLAAGTKSGSISIWRIHRPASYSVEHCDDSVNLKFAGFIKAHNSWVTALSWGFLPSNSGSQVLLASAGCDGSVRIWYVCVADLEKLSETEHIAFSLFNEVTAGDNVLVSSLSLCVPAQSSRKIFLAAGKGSGAFDVWTCNVKTKRSKKVGSYDAHVQSVTGLAWAFDGHCLYSCSQDNSMHGWIYHKGSLSKVSMPPNNLGLRSFSDLPSVSDSCYGMAISPGNLALAVARRFDVGQLDHMYQKRTQRAAVEFFWIGGQQMDFPSSLSLEPDIECGSGFTQEELGYWGSKLLWSLKEYECRNKHLVIWDIVAALSAFKSCAPKFFKNIIQSWLDLLLKDKSNSSATAALPYVLKNLSNISSRQLHLLNILCRRVIVPSEFESLKVCAKQANLPGSYGEKEECWVDVIVNSEKELRERLVGLSLSTAVGYVSDGATRVDRGLWNPAGITQMVKWVLQNQDSVHCQLNLLASEIRRHGARLQSMCDYNIEDEQCIFCLVTVPFESPEIASCKGVSCDDREASQRHKLTRCSVSMKVCPLNALWYCICCQRRAMNLPPLQLFTMDNFPQDFTSFIKPLRNNLLPIPLCPFCGISLQKLQPDFLLCTSPV